MKIHKSMLAFVAMFCAWTVQAQSVNDVGKIALSVVMPENVDGLTVSQLSKLQSKIVQIVTKSGLSGAGFTQTFVIYPKFEIYETNVVEGGMQNITIVQTELSLFIKQTSNNLLFASVNKTLKGSGKSKELAITNAIAQINVLDRDFKLFVDAGKKKILQYYESNCDNIIQKADSYTQMQQYAQALGLLLSMPEEISACYNRILNKSVETYKAYQTHVCAEQMQQAKAKQAASDYDSALSILAAIDPSASCFNEAQLLAKSIGSKISEERQKQWDAQMKRHDDAVALEKQRIEAAKKVALEYYKSQPATVNYNYIVK